MARRFGRPIEVLEYLATPVRDGGLGIPLDAFNFFANPLHLAVVKADLVLARWLLKQPGVRMRQRLRFFPFACTELELAKIPVLGSVISGPQAKRMLEFLQTEAQEQRTLLQAMSSENFAGRYPLERRSCIVGLLRVTLLPIRCLGWHVPRHFQADLPKSGWTSQQ